MPESPSLAAAIRFSVTGLIEHFHAFVAWNFLLVLAAALIVSLQSLASLALLAVPLLAPLVCGVMRLATVAWRGDHVALRTAMPGLRHRLWTKVGLAAAQCLLLLLTMLNLVVAPAIGGLLAALSMATSVYVSMAVLAYAIVGWTLLCDPRRESLRIGQVARLSLLVLLRRPLGFVVVTLLTALASVIAYNLVVPSLFLPSMILLLAAAYVLPEADRLAATPAG